MAEFNKPANKLIRYVSKWLDNDFKVACKRSKALHDPEAIKLVNYVKMISESMPVDTGLIIKLRYIERLTDYEVIDRLSYIKPEYGRRKRLAVLQFARIMYERDLIGIGLTNGGDNETNS